MSGQRLAPQSATGTRDAETAHGAADARAADPGLAERVSAHMERFEEAEAGGWLVARDHRDGTAVVVWRHGTDPHMPGGARGILIYRWLCSLRDAGFTATPRTDMEVFGRPDEQSPDGRAQWLHITGWDPEQARLTCSIPDLADELKHKLGIPAEHTVRLSPAMVPPLPRAGTGAREAVHGLRFRYSDGRVHVTAVFERDAELLPRPPDWVLALADEHKSHGDGWCTTEAVNAA